MLMMIQIDDTIISTELFDMKFCCDLAKCKGECCVEGDSGAPLEEEELPLLEKSLPLVWDDLSEKSKKLIKAQGVSYIDEEGDLVTSIVDGCECVFTFFDEKGVCKCALEKAYRAGLSDFYKPISCHLYPIRLQKLSNGTIALNVHKWRVCKSAFTLGEEKGIPLYKFLKEPLVRRFGNEWYEKVCEVAIELENMKNKDE